MSAAAASSSAAPTKRLVQKPINVVHRFKEGGQRVCIWLVNDNHLRFEGTILGYDEFMNVVLDDATQIVVKSGKAPVSTPIGRMLLKGDTVGLMHQVSA